MTTTTPTGDSLKICPVLTVPIYIMWMPGNTPIQPPQNRPLDNKTPLDQNKPSQTNMRGESEKAIPPIITKAKMTVNSIAGMKYTVPIIGITFF